MRLLRLVAGERGDAGILGLLMVGLAALAFAANSANLIGGLSAIKNKEVATERVEELRKTAEAKQAEAEQIAPTDPAVADLLKRHARELNRVADVIEANADDTFQGEKKSLDGKLPDWVPDKDYYSDEFGMAIDHLVGVEGLSDIPFLITQYNEAKNRGDRTMEEALGRALGDKIKGRKPIFRDIARARLNTLYRARSGENCFNPLTGQPTDEEAWAVSINELRRLYRGSVLVNKEEFRQAVEDVTGVPFGRAEVSLAGCSTGGDEPPPEPEPEPADEPEPTPEPADEPEAVEPFPWSYKGTLNWHSAARISGKSVSCSDTSTIDITINDDGSVTGSLIEPSRYISSSGCGAEGPDTTYAITGTHGEGSFSAIFGPNKVKITGSFTDQSIKGSGSGVLTSGEASLTKSLSFNVNRSN